MKEQRGISKMILMLMHQLILDHTKIKQRKMDKTNSVNKGKSHPCTDTEALYKVVRPIGGVEA